jgi:hypothetical protein
MPVGVFSFCGTPTRPTAPPGRADFERADDRLVVADALEHRMCAEAVRQFTPALDRFVAALADDVGRAERLAQRDPIRVPAEQDDPLGAEPLRGDDAAESDSAVAYDSDGLAAADLRRARRVMAGAHHVREGEQRRHQFVVLGDRQHDERAVCLRDANRFALASVDTVSAVPAAVQARRVQPFAAEEQVPSDQRNGATTRSPGLSVCASAPTASTMPMNSCPIRCPVSVGCIWLYGHRSLPQIQARVTRTSASVRATILASGTFSIRTSPAPYMTVARMPKLKQRATAGDRPC